MANSRYQCLADLAFQVAAFSRWARLGRKAEDQLLYIAPKTGKVDRFYFSFGVVWRFAKLLFAFGVSV